MSLIRKATIDDMPYILELLYELDRPKPIDDKEVEIFKEKIENYFSDTQKSLFVAEQESKIVGLVSIIFLQRLNHAQQEMYIPELIVTTQKRSTGIGKQLMTYCIDLAMKHDCYRIRLESGNLRKKSHEFYKNLGFIQSSLSFSNYIVIILKIR